MSILAAVDKKNVDRVDDETLIFADMAQKALRQVQEFVAELLADKLPEENVGFVAKALPKAAGRMITR